MPKRKDLHYWNIPVTKHLDTVLEKAITINGHVSKSDFIRDAVRIKLMNMGLKDDLNTIMKQDKEL
jgi:hypothetical protein